MIYLKPPYAKKRDLDIHNYETQILQCFRLIEQDLSENNARLIRKYDQYLVTQTLSKAYRTKTLRTLLTLSRLLKKDWTDITKDDIDGLVYKVNQLYSNEKGQETHTTADCKKYLKMFFRWIKLDSKNFNDVGDPDEIKHIRVKKIQDTMSREDLITEDDFTRLIHTSKNPRTRAMIAISYEGGLRPGELLSMKIKHVKFDDYGAMLAVDGKTGPRTVRLIKNVPHLSQWLNYHPSKDNPDSALFVQMEGKNYGMPLNYYAARKALMKVVHDAGFSKRIYPNLFRHSEATQLANFMTEAQLRKRHGWSPTSKMPARYVHLINADVDDALMKHYGITKKEQNKVELPQKCSICDMMNPSNEKFCYKCRHPLDLKTAIELDEHKSQEKINHDSIKQQLEQMQKDFDKKIESIEMERGILAAALENFLHNENDENSRQMARDLHRLFELTPEEIQSQIN